MPLFRSASNLNPDFHSPINDLPIDELTKSECKRRLSFKKSFFTWSTQKDFLDKNKFVFDSDSVMKSRHNSFAIKSSKSSKSSKSTCSGSSINYDESDNEYSSDSEGDLKKDGYFSMEDIENIDKISGLKKTSKNKRQFSESTLIYSSNTNTINTVSLEFKTKISNNDDINYGFEDNNHINEAEDTGDNSGENSGNSSNNSSNNSNGNSDNTNENNDNNNTDNNIDISDIIDEINNINIDTIDDIDKLNLNELEEEDESDDSDLENDLENDEIEKEKDKLTDYPNNSSYTVPKPIFKTNSTTKKTVTFSDDVVIIEPRKPRKGKNLFKRAILKIMKKKEEEKIEE